MYRRRRSRKSEGRKLRLTVAIPVDDFESDIVFLHPAIHSFVNLRSLLRVQLTL